MGDHPNKAGPGDPVKNPFGLRLGIDAGGTFTDAVLLDGDDRVVATAKSLTTRFDLAEGVGNAIGLLPADLLNEVELVALSTTLTTNAVVEGTGTPVAALLVGYGPGEVKSSGLVALLGTEFVVTLDGGHDTDGNALCELDAAAAQAAIRRLAPRVSAFAISGMFGVRNPGHELAVRAIVRSLCECPVTCGHELASSLGAPRRAMTAALNARMIAHVTALIASVEATLARLGIRAPLMMVKGDGSLTSAASAMQRPVGTVLSGPAASVIGACALSGRREGIVADMGGTTTDIAVVRDGRPELAFDGALIGGWRPMVEAARVYAIGIGGDSEVRFCGTSQLVIGPRRVVPLSLLVHQHPDLLPVLERQVRETPHATHARFALRLQSDALHLAQLTPAEDEAWQRLCAGPVDLQQASATDRTLARAVARLERKGLAIYTGFTPTDAAHVLGMSDHWSKEAAVLGARLWARQMRYIHGYGTWGESDVEGPARRIYECVVDAICHKLVEAGLNDAGQMNEKNAARIAGLLTMLALGRGAPQPASRLPVFQLRFNQALPLIAVGAPAASWYPRVAESLGMELALPMHAEVANAVGAVLGQVTQRVHLAVTQPVRGVFRVFTHAGARDFATLGEALSHAREVAAHEAGELAREAGAARVDVEWQVEDNSAADDTGTRIFFEARVTASASGPPRTAAHRMTTPPPISP